MPAGGRTPKICTQINVKTQSCIMVRVCAENSYQTSTHSNKMSFLYVRAKTIQYLRSGAQNTNAC
jgi:hypothetical protein